MKSRIMEGKMKLVKNMMESENALVRGVVREVRGDRDCVWNKQLIRYMEEVGIGVEVFENLDADGIGKKVREYDNRKWREEMGRKSSTSLYREYKERIEEEKFYNNSKASEILFRARANTINLEIFSGNWGGGYFV